jgi:replicative DNA helicase
VAIIDYLQIVPEKRQKGESTTERLDRMSAETKQIADNLGITVLELSQVTVDSHGVATTRYSSGITNDADQLWHVVGDDDDNKAKIDKTIVVAKQREGPKGEVEFTYEKALTRFTEK